MSWYVHVFFPIFFFHGQYQETQRVMSEFMKQNQMAEMSQEMMDDAFDAMDGDDIEDGAEDVMAQVAEYITAFHSLNPNLQVLDEIGIDTSAMLAQHRPGTKVLSSHKKNLISAKDCCRSSPCCSAIRDPFPLFFGSE